MQMSKNVNNDVSKDPPIKQPLAGRGLMEKLGQPSDVFSENPVKIKIPLGLLQRGVTENKKILKLLWLLLMLNPRIPGLI